MKSYWMMTKWSIIQFLQGKVKRNESEIKTNH